MLKPDKLFFRLVWSKNKSGSHGQQDHRWTSNWSDQQNYICMIQMNRKALGSDAKFECGNYMFVSKWKLISFDPLWWFICNEWYLFLLFISFYFPASILLHPMEPFYYRKMNGSMDGFVDAGASSHWVSLLPPMFSYCNTSFLSFFFAASSPLLQLLF